MAVSIKLIKHYIGGDVIQIHDYIGVWNMEDAFGRKKDGYVVIQGTIIPDWSNTGESFYDPETDSNYDYVQHNGEWK